MNRRLQIAAVAAMVVMTVAPAAVSANSQMLSGKWRTVDSNTTKTYTFDYTNMNSCHANQFTLTASVALGTVTSTGAYIKNVTWTYRTFYGGYGVVGSNSIVQDYLGQMAVGHDTVSHPAQGASYTHVIGRTMRFSQTQGIVIEKYDASGCAYESQLAILFLPGNPG